MMEREETIIGPKESDDAVLDFVNFQAQEAILNPNLPGDFKDMIVGDAIRKIQRIGERRATYQVQDDGEPHDIYEA